MCRAATPRDLTTILAYIRELAAIEGHPEAVTATPSDLHALLFGPKPVAEAVIVLDPESGSSVGYAWFYLTTATFRGRSILFLEDLYVARTARGRGLGVRMMRWLARSARERGCASVDWSIVEGNAPAIRFYEQLGATPKSGSVGYRLCGDALARLDGGGR